MFARLIAWIFAALSAHAATAHAADRAPAAPSPAPGSSALLIVHSEHLADAAHEWAAYRTSTGWTVSTHSVAPAAPGAHSQTRAAQLLAHIDRAWGDALAGGATEFAVLLLGDADDRGIPTFHFPQRDPDLKHRLAENYASDHPYRAGDITRDQPHFALGRVPARTDEEARIALAKVKAYEAAGEPSLWNRRINCIAGEGHFGMLDALLEQVFTAMVDSLVPSSFDMSMTYAKATSMYCPPIDALTPTILRRLAEDALMFVYVGHGSPTALDDFYWRGERRAMLRASDLDTLAADGAHRPIAVLACCSTGWFDLPNGERSLAEAMLFAPHGPVAVLAGSRPTHPYANAVFLEALTRRMTAGSARTLGALDVLVKRDMLRSPSARDPIDLVASPIASSMGWATSLRDHRRMHVRLYNLIGDPCLRLPDLGMPIAAQQNGRTITGTIEGMNTGSVDIIVQTRRDQPALASAMQRVTSEDDPDLPAKTAANYEIVNDRTLATLTAAVAGGRFTAELPETLDSRAAVVTMHARGEGADGQPMFAHGSLALRKKLRRAASTAR